MLDILGYDFMRRALLVALLTGVMAPAIGTYVVQRRLALLGDGLGHIAIAGVGLALLTGSQPLPVAIVVAVLGAVLVELLRQRGRASGDVGLAILFYGGLAAGVLMAGITGAGAGALSQYLFGSLTSLTTGDVVVVAVLTLVVLVPAIGLSPQLFAVCADEDHAKVLGLPVRGLSFLVVVLAAVAVTVSMRTVGLLLVSALMVVPVAASQGVVRGFRTSLFAAMGVGALVTVSGAVGSFYADVAPGALIVLIAIGVFVASWPLAALLERRRRAGPAPLPRVGTGDVVGAGETARTGR